MQPASIASKNDRRVGLSPGGCRQNSDWCIAFKRDTGLLQDMLIVFPANFVVADDPLATCKMVILL